MKRILSVCLTFCMLLGAVSGLSLLTGATGSAAVWNGSTDTSWYNTTDTVFTLTDGADLAGFAAIVNGTAEGITQTNFEGKTVRLGANIVLNEGDAKTWGPSTAGLQAFPMIGLQDSSYSFANVAKYFSGEFDGQGHTISGMYVNRKCNARGEGSAMFAGIYGGARIHDFALVNSFVQNPTGYSAAAVVAYAYVKSAQETDAFHIYNIYTDATVVAPGGKDMGIAGILGTIGYETQNTPETNVHNTISSCVFAGSVRHTKSGNANVGAILGNPLQNGVVISDCLNIGSYVSEQDARFIAGIVGKAGRTRRSTDPMEVFCNTSLTRCVNAVATDTESIYSAELMAMEDSYLSSRFFVKDCYYVGNKPAVTRNGKAYTNVSATKVTAEQLTGLGVSGEITSKLTGWILRDGQVMIPAGAAAVVPSEPSHFAPVTEGGVAFRGVQNTGVQDGIFNLRFIGTVDSLQYSALGYDLSCTWAGGAKPEAAFTTDTVYKTVTATGNGMTKQYTAEGFSAAYLWAVTVTGIPAAGDVTFTVKPFSCDPEGNKTTLGMYTLIYRDGQFVSLTEQK